MAKPRALILRSPGTNCDAETSAAFEMAGAVSTQVHINALLDSPAQLSEFQIVCFPGGFSYGDDLSAGQIMALKVKSRLFERLANFPAEGKLVLGICNGFQVLIKTGLLFQSNESDSSGMGDLDSAHSAVATNSAVAATSAVASLTWNTCGRYVDRWVRLTPTDSPCVFLRGVESLYLPIAHGEGRFVVRDAETLNELERRQQLALRYYSNGETDNPNGSTLDVAGVCDPTGHVFGLMPHPERHIYGTQHPRWTREGLNVHPDGRFVFENAVAYFG